MSEDLWRELLPPSTVYQEAARRVHFGLAAEKIKTNQGIFHVVTFYRKEFFSLTDCLNLPARFGIEVTHGKSLYTYLATTYQDYDFHGFAKDIIILVKKENKGDSMNEVKIESRDSIRFGDIIVKDDTAHIVTLDHAANYIVLVKLANGTTRAFSAVGYVIGSQVNIAGILANAGFNNYRVIRNPEIIIREK